MAPGMVWGNMEAGCASRRPDRTWRVLGAQIFHPNIDWEGKICLNILREDWKPILDIGENGRRP